MAKRGDWVPCRGYGEVVSLNAGSPAADVLLVRHGQRDVGDDIQEVVETGDDILIQRVVGQVRINTLEGQALVAMRVRLGLYTDETNLVAFYAASLFDGDDANEPFLWQRYLAVAAQDTFDVFADPAWSMLDVRVARRIPRDQALFLSLQILTNDSVITYTPYLRTWARNVG